MTILRLGVVGCGVIGPTHLAAAAPNSRVKLVAVADLIADRAKRAAEQFGVSRWTTDAIELLQAPDIDAIILAMPTTNRTELAPAVLRAGKHLLLEKPAAMNSDELRRLAPLCGDRVVACASSRFRYSPVGQALTRILKTDPVGPLRLIQVRASGTAESQPTEPPSWRLSRSLNGGGILVNWGVYDLDFLLGSLGWSLEPAQVSAACWRVLPGFSKWVAAGSDAETHVKALIRFTSGPVLDYERAELNAGKGEAVWRIIGEKGALDIPMLGGDGCRITLSEATPTGLREQVLWTQQGPSPDIHAGPITDFVDAILDGRPPLTGLDQAITLTRITDMIYQSAEDGRCVETPLK